jgi:hypothetical protein
LGNTLPSAPVSNVASEDKTRPPVTGGSERLFNHGQAKYASEHRTGPDQHTRHIIGDAQLQHYGADPANYSKWSQHNYRMGSQDTNMRDRMLDYHITGESFKNAGRPGGYDAQLLTQGTDTTPGLTYQQQVDGIKARFDAAGTAYKMTGERAYQNMQNDLRQIASEHLNADLRQFRMTTTTEE